MLKIEGHKRGAIIFVFVSLLVLSLSLFLLVNKDEDITDNTTFSSEEAADQLADDYNQRASDQEDNVVSENDLSEVEQKLQNPDLQEYERTELLIDGALIADKLGDPRAKDLAEQALSKFPDDEYARQYYAGLVQTLKDIVGSNTNE